MKILFITIMWPREGDRNLYSDLMEEFIEHGHEVYVCTINERRRKEPTICFNQKGIQVLRVKTGNVTQTKSIEKLISLFRLNYQLKRSINKYFKYAKFDLIIFPTPPITLVGLLSYLKRKNQAGFYLLLKDIWPQGSVDLGLIRKGSFAWRVFRLLEKKLYQTADYIGCMSPKGVEYVLKNNPNLSEMKVEECPNSIRLKEIITIDAKKVREKYDIPMDKTIFIFGGNLGIGHGLEFLMNAIKALADYKKAFFVIAGSGIRFNFVKRTFNQNKPLNALLLNHLPKDDYNAILQSSDVGLILLERKYTVPQFPSRLLGFLEYGKPVLCAVNQETDIGFIVEKSGCGFSLLHGDLDSFVDKVHRLSEGSEMRNQMGRNAKILLETKYSTLHSYNVIAQHFMDLSS